MRIGECQRRRDPDTSAAAAQIHYPCWWLREPGFEALRDQLSDANLVDNALKFCGRGERITLAARHAGDTVQVSVADTGHGIAAADLPHLFDRFYQSRHSVAPATGEGGKGLGLAIVKRIAELHGGSVSVQSAQGHGTTVTLSLPAA